MEKFPLYHPISGNNLHIFIYSAPKVENRLHKITEVNFPYTLILQAKSGNKTVHLGEAIADFFMVD
jgi:hypothetical protein